MRTVLVSVLLALLPLAGAAAGPAAAPGPIVREVLTQPLPDYPGKEALLLTVEFPPGGVDPVHRHDAHAVVYVLEGSIVMGVAGGPEVTLGPGETFHEGPDDLHTVGRNASTTKRARFIVFMLKDIGKPAVLPPH
ncbi:cupin domain-containing protein [Stenotrophomonas maltophilia]|uniref:cupin domain-containing protein n=1 Tax=Stenotrophomonas maltophilia TaxID=40324 RepID=UPI0012B0D756|nr:cupin domain-containing protein [Stenotrophomonas maltophilia]QGM05633.1 cupin domain-containing protein [Stenotrophomonas maltophilia]